MSIVCCHWLRSCQLRFVRNATVANRNRQQECACARQRCRTNVQFAVNKTHANPFVTLCVCHLIEVCSIGFESKWNHYVWMWRTIDFLMVAHTWYVDNWWSCLNRNQMQMMHLQVNPWIELTSRQNFLHVSLDRCTAIPSTVFKLIFAFTKSHAYASGNFIHQRCVCFANVMQFATQTTRFFAYQMWIK